MSILLRGCCQHVLNLLSLLLLYYTDASKMLHKKTTPPKQPWFLKLVWGHTLQNFHEQTEKIQMHQYDR